MKCDRRWYNDGRVEREAEELRARCYWTAQLIYPRPGMFVTCMSGATARDDGGSSSSQPGSVPDAMSYFSSGGATA